MDFDTAIGRIPRRTSRRELGQVEYGGLQPAQRGVGEVRVEARIVERGIVGALEQLFDMRLRLSAPGRKQAVS